MRKLLRFSLPVLVIGLAVAAFAGLAALGRGKQPERRDSGPKAVLVDVIRAQVRSVNIAVMSQGTVKPRTETELVPEVSGKIMAVSSNFVPGGFFRAGEVLLQIDPSDYETALSKAQAELAAREAQFADQKARSEQALRDWQNLGRSGEPSDLTLRKPQLAEALAAVKAAQAGLQQAERDLVRTRIQLPYDGLVRSKLVDVGQFVAPGTTLGVTFAIDTAEVRLPLTGPDIAFLDLPRATDLANGERSQVTLTAEGSGIAGQWQAEIIRTEGVIDEASRVIYVIAQVVDPYGVLGVSRPQQLLMGTFVRAEIQGRRAENVVVLPRSVLQPNDTVLIASEDGKLEIRPVEVLRAEPERVYIKGGITDRERVITTALSAPIPGTLVTISEKEADAAIDPAKLATTEARQ